MGIVNVYAGDGRGDLRTLAGISSTHTGAFLPAPVPPAVSTAATMKFWVRPVAAAASIYAQLIKPDGSATLYPGTSTPVGGNGVFTIVIPAGDLSTRGEYVLIVYDDSSYSSVVCSTSFTL